MAPRSRSGASARSDLIQQGRERASAQGIDLDKAFASIAKTLELAQNNGGQSARATIEAQNNTIRAQGEQLKAAYDQIRAYEGVVKAQMADWGALLKKIAEATKVDGEERMQLAKLAQEGAFWTELAKAIGPSAPPVLMAILRKFGVIPDDGALLLNADGTEIERDRAAFWETINTISIRPDLQEALSGAVGAEKWARTLTHLQREFMTAQAAAVKTHAQSNGTSN